MKGVGMVAIHLVTLTSIKPNDCSYIVLYMQLNDAFNKYHTFPSFNHENVF